MENDIKEMKIGSQIRKYRNNMELSQEQLAGKIYVSRQTVSNWEEHIKETEIRKLDKYGKVYTMLLINVSSTK